MLGKFLEGREPCDRELRPLKVRRTLSHGLHRFKSISGGFLRAVNVEHDKEEVGSSRACSCRPLLRGQSLKSPGKKACKAQYRQETRQCLPLLQLVTWHHDLITGN